LYIILFLFLFLTVVVINIHLFLDRDFNRIKFGEKGELPGMIYLHKYYRADHLPPFASKYLPNQVKGLENGEGSNN